MSEEIKYEYKVQFMANRGSWVDCRPTFSNIINARVFKRRYESMYKHVQTRIVHRPAEWEVHE
jgi:hypothetical protein